MKTFGKALLFALMLVVAGCSTTDKSGWTTYHAGPFNMDIPKDLKQTPRQGTDSYIGEFQNATMLLTFDYGLSSNNFEDWPTDTEYQLVTIDDHPGRIGTVHRGFKPGYNHSTQVSFRETGGKFLTITVACGTKDDVATAKKIFMSVKFNPNRPH